MSFNLKEYKDKLLFVPLGGASEIGINVNLYHFQGKWIMIDCGSGFADEYLPGVDIIVADLSFIEARKKDLLGIVLTHAHEDHLGAIQYLWNNLQSPIYTTLFTKNFLQAKLAEYSFSDKVSINIVQPGVKFDLGPFSLEMTPLTHSAPEMQALMIRTSAGNILHTGDWKFDHDPIIGEISDEKILKSYGDEGVLALVCDSTNVFSPGTSGSEGDLRRSLVDIIAGCPRLVVVTTFASNLARLDTLIHAGQLAGRKVILTGRSLHRMLAAAQSSGYLSDIPTLMDERNFSKYKREELLVIATGCQGEPMAAVAKMASNSHHSINLAPKDTVIFSSKIIPGNEKKIFRLFNKFVKKNVEVITERDHFVHVSGHPSIDELKRMYELVRPEICIPVHGEPVHIHEHARLAKSSGIKHTIEVENGSVALLDQFQPKIISRVENGYLAIDGNYLLPTDSNVFKMRRRMSESGIVVVSLIVDGKYKLLTKPIISAPGLLEDKEDIEIVELMQNNIILAIDDFRKKEQGRILLDQIKACASSVIKRSLRHEINKAPLVIVNVEEV